MPRHVAARYREFRYRSLFGGLTHEQYLEEPAIEVDWLLAIADTTAEAEAALRKKAAG